MFKSRYWPGTNILKSTNNDFNWQQRESKLMEVMSDHIQRSQAGKAGAKTRAEIGATRGEPYYMTPLEKAFQKTFTTYSKAVPSVFNGKGKKV